jgi:hypothetical protein
MGYLSLLATCVACRQPFTCNPYRVPSIPIEGVRQPVCRSCIEAANRRRAALGNEPIAVLPGAYDPADEYDPLAEDADD